MLHDTRGIALNVVEKYSKKLASAGVNVRTFWPPAATADWCEIFFLKALTRGDYNRMMFIIVARTVIHVAAGK